MARKGVTIATALGALAIAAAGCGSSSSGSSMAATKTTAAAPAAPAGGHALKISADPSGALKFTTTKLSAKAGKVTIQMVNPSGVPHSIAIKGNGVNQLSPQAQVSGGKTATVTATLKPGTYEFFCPIPGHEAAGMKGTLTVS